MIFQDLGSLSVISVGTGNFDAANATLPKVVLRPLDVCVMTLLAATHSAAGTFHSSAAACTNIMRAAAPPLRTYCSEVRMPRLPPVEKSPQGRLRAKLCPGVGYSVVTFFQSHSSSSATICAKPVIVPWPISERTTRTTTVSSGLMTTHTPISGVAATDCAELIKGNCKPIARPVLTAVEPTINCLREGFGTRAFM